MAFARLSQVYRSCFFQIIIVGIVSLCEPGIWNALNNLGAGGEASPLLNNAANALTYGIMSFGCTVAGGISNKYTAKWTLVVGAAFYTPYAAGLYCNNRYGNQWFMLLGAGLCGIGASLLWASEAAIAVGYPEDAKRGRYVGVWSAIRQVGPLIGGSISLALNADEARVGKVGYDTYLGLIAISCLGAPCALLLSHPGKVIRSDGTRVPFLKKTNLSIESRAIWRQLKSPYMLLLIPLFLAGQFGNTYQGNYLTTYFTVRSRALASFLTAIVGFLANILTGILLDLPFSRSLKSKSVYIGTATLVTASWIWNAVEQVKFSAQSPPPRLDWDDGALFNSAFAVYMLFRFFYESLQIYIYWLMGEAEGGQRSGDIARTTGILKSWEAIGNAVAYGIGATSVPDRDQMVIGFVLWVVTVPLTLMALYGNWGPVKLVAGEDENEDSGIGNQRVVVVVGEKS